MKDSSRASAMEKEEVILLRAQSTVNEGDELLYNLPTPRPNYVIRSDAEMAAPSSLSGRTVIQIPTHLQEEAAALIPMQVAMEPVELIPLCAVSTVNDDELFFDLPIPRPKYAVYTDAENEALSGTITIQIPVQGEAATAIPMREILRQKEANVFPSLTRTLFQRIRRSFRYPSQNGQNLLYIINQRRPTSVPELPFGGRFVAPLNRRRPEFDGHRPYFTYYITYIQVVIMIAALCRYGIGTSFASNFFGVTERSGNVMAASSSKINLVIWEQNNIWIGPRYADLIHMGAKYSPCMRKDLRIMEQIEEERRIESEETGCCISSEGCYQTSECPKQFSRFIKWTKDENGVAVSRAVCGQDPRYCRSPASVSPHQWSKDISKWPICLETSTQIPSSESHMQCKIRGRPCCISLHGQCRITTKEYCEFVKGYYHENATLCSQVSCLGDICGMTPFLGRDNPDQFYRFFTPLFIHAGIAPMIATVFLQFIFMKRLEVLIGWTKIALIYFGSGIGGYLASAIFAPYMPQVGPVPSQAGILGAMMVFVCYNWSVIEKPYFALFCHLGVALLFFAGGFLPFIDNFAQVFGFFFGALLACALFPFTDVVRYLNPEKRTSNFYASIRMIIVSLSMLEVIALYIFLFLVFAAVDPSNLPDISVLSCNWMSGRSCDQQSLQLKDWLPI